MFLKMAIKIRLINHFLRWNNFQRFLNDFQYRLSVQLEQQIWNSNPKRVSNVANKGSGYMHAFLWPYYRPFQSVNVPENILTTYYHCARLEITFSFSWSNISKTFKSFIKKILNINEPRIKALFTEIRAMFGLKKRHQ